MELDSTKAGPTANSYADTDQADDYLESLYGADEWAGLTDDQKEALLITATRDINGLFVMFPSATNAQALKFPVNSYNRTDKEGRLLGDGYDKATEATIIQAYYLLQHSDELQEAEANRIQGVTSEKIGQASQSSSGYNPMAMISPVALRILSPYLGMAVKAAR